MALRNPLVIFFLLLVVQAYGQQDVDFHLQEHLLPGKRVLKVKRDFKDPYLWVLAENDEVYRVNSLTFTVEDFTSSFSAYNNLHFNDIAGRSRDTVFVATKSNNLIEFKKGILKVIGPADGLNGTINQVGMETYNFGLLIATTSDMYSYNCVKETIAPYHAGAGQNRIFETTYRTDCYSALSYNGYFDSTKQYPVINHLSQTEYGGALFYRTPAIGDTINTAYYVPDGFEPYGWDWDDVDYMTQIWGTEKGLFQNNWDDSYYLTSAWAHYLDGIKVNKVTSIYGLLSFGDDFVLGLIKENLLVGTDKGLYFSSSGYRKYINGPLFNYNTFTLDADIGNQVINDICVNATASSPQNICEDGAWVAASDGLYFIKPDYGAYLSNQHLKAVSFKGQPDTLSTLNLCQGNAATAIINPSIHWGATYQWYKDGQQLSAQNADTLKITVAGDYYAVLYDPCSALHIESNHLKVNIISGPVFSFNYPDKMQQCDNTPDTLKTDYNPGYHYRWYTNGALNGDTTSSFIVTQTGKYKVEVSACTNSWVPSKEVEVDLITLPVPQLAADKPVYCAEDVANLTVNTPTDPGYTINWYRDGSTLPADNNLTSIGETNPGKYIVTISSNISTCTQTSQALQLAFTPAPVFTFDYPDELQYCDGTPLTLKAAGSATYQYRWYKDGTLTGDVNASLAITQAGKYKVEVSACAGSWLPSKEVQVDFVQLIVPVITPDKPAYCTGDNAILRVNATADLDETINWYKDNVLLTASTNESEIVTSVAGNYTVSIINNIVNSDGTTCSETSAVQSISFNPPPAVTIEKIVNTTICDGQTICLTAHYSGGAVKWSTGETTDRINVTAPGNYKVTVTTASGCQTDASVDVSFLPNPVFSVSDTAICTYKKQVVTLTAPAGFSQYAWNGQPGGQTYDVSSPQTVSLTVTDANGCQATQQIKVAEQCANVYIPNAFTPNGDGINDTWVIQGLDSDPSATVKVFTRYGAQVFESKGYGTPWNGEYNDKKLPAGVYYYIITAKNGTQKFSGSLTIIY